MADSWASVSKGGDLGSRLTKINEDKDLESFEKLGGVGTLATALDSDTTKGLTTEQAQVNSEKYGANRFKEVPPRSFGAILLEQLKDPTLILLMVAATVSTVLGAAIPEEREEQGYVEGIAIWIAVVAVSMVGAGNDYQKDQQFRKLNKQKDTIDVKVFRDGQEALIKNDEVVVGDLMILDTGDKVIADGFYVTGHSLVIDEASLTGESDPIRKNESRPWCRSGTQVTEGSGRMLVVAVGERSEWGKTLAFVVTESEETPLQEKLGFLASAIGKIGFIVASAAFIILIIRWMVDNKGFPLDKINDVVGFLTYSITIVVVAVPEGLPLAVTISLAYSMKKMLKDNNFVRVLAACETMGGATAICSDKTGTLTENRMTVVAGWFAGTQHHTAPAPDAVPAAVRELIQENICMNSTAFLVENPGQRVEFVGNRTECALLTLVKHGWGVDYQAERLKLETNVKHLYGFSSAKKMASVLMDRGDCYRLYNKGAAEIVLARCVSWHDASGTLQPLDDAKRSELMDAVTTMATTGLRTLCLTYRDFPTSTPESAFDKAPDEQLVACCIVGIKDPVREEVPAAVQQCKDAGILVRMVTGDNIHTAQHIARECGILGEGGLALEGPVFRDMPEEELIKLLPKLQVLARSSPTDKHTLVNLLKRLGEVVAVTGDGTNDAPALKESDVGLAMGIAGTEVAKEAADIVILDDNFSSIVKAVLWGRSVFNNIRKFLQFQLTINAVALIIAFIGAFAQKEPLNVLQLLWVNLIMDTMAALALATENPHPGLLNHKPHGRDEPLINVTMWKHILIQSVYQLFWLLVFLFAVPLMWDRYNIREQCEVAQDFIADIDGATGGVSAGDAAIREGLRVWLDPAGGDCPSVREPEASFYGCAEDADCPALDAANDVYHEWERHYEDEKEHDEEGSLSVLFNAFIFMQVFNELNARKIRDEYNILDGLFTSAIFCGVLVITVVLQIIIMQTPINQFFKVGSLDWQEWLATVAIGFGVIPLSLFTRFVSRMAGCSPVLTDDINQNKQHNPAGATRMDEVEMINGGAAALQDSKQP